MGTKIVHKNIVNKLAFPTIFQGIFTPYDPSFYGIFWGRIFFANRGRPFRLQGEATKAPIVRKLQSSSLTHMLCTFCPLTILGDF